MTRRKSGDQDQASDQDQGLSQDKAWGQSPLHILLLSLGNARCLGLGKAQAEASVMTLSPAGHEESPSLGCPLPALPFPSLPCPSPQHPKSFFVRETSLLHRRFTGEGGSGQLEGCGWGGRGIFVLGFLPANKHRGAEPGGPEVGLLLSPVGGWIRRALP